MSLVFVVLFGLTVNPENTHQNNVELWSKTKFHKKWKRNCGPKIMFTNNAMVLENNIFLLTGWSNINP